MIPKIGRVYNIDYTRLHDVVTFEDATLCQLPDMRCDVLIDSVNDHADLIEEEFNRIWKKSEKYRSLLKKYSTLKKKEAKAETKELIDAEKEKLFGNQKIKFDPIDRADNLFIRYFIPKNVTVNEKSSLKVLYTGKRLTTKGKVVHRWIVLSPAKIRSQYIDDEVRKFLDILD